jgi:hypothetical protein
LFDPHFNGFNPHFVCGLTTFLVRSIDLDSKSPFLSIFVGEIPIHHSLSGASRRFPPWPPPSLLWALAALQVGVKMEQGYNVGPLSYKLVYEP